MDQYVSADDEINTDLIKIWKYGFFGYYFASVPPHYKTISTIRIKTLFSN